MCKNFFLDFYEDGVFHYFLAQHMGYFIKIFGEIPKKLAQIIQMEQVFVSQVQNLAKVIIEKVFHAYSGIIIQKKL